MEWRWREGFLVRIEAHGGVGYGEVAPIPEFGTETISAAGAFLEALCADPGLGVPPELPCCAFGVSAALSAARGAGGARRGHRVAALLPAGGAAIEALRERRSEGYGVFKWKIGAGPVAGELAVFGELVSMLPRDGRLRLDANGGLERTALARWAAAAERSGAVDFIEQPLPPGAEAAMAAAAADGPAIALDESVCGPDGARWLAPGAWAGPLVVKPALMGEVGALARRLHAVGAGMVLSSAFETGIGVENVLRLADGLPESLRPIGFDTGGLFDDELNPLPRGPEYTVGARERTDPEAIWNEVRHMS